jgi:hypothetical protein
MRTQQIKTHDNHASAPTSARSQGGLRSGRRQTGKWGYILLWLLGVPIPVLFLFYLLRGCT